MLQPITVAIWEHLFMNINDLRFCLLFAFIFISIYKLLQQQIHMDITTSLCASIYISCHVMTSLTSCVCARPIRHDSPPICSRNAANAAKTCLSCVKHYYILRNTFLQIQRRHNANFKMANLETSHRFVCALELQSYNSNGLTYTSDCCYYATTKRLRQLVNWKFL